MQDVLVRVVPQVCSRWSSAAQIGASVMGTCLRHALAPMRTV